MLVNCTGHHRIRQSTSAQPVAPSGRESTGNQAVVYLGSMGPTAKIVYGSPTPITFVDFAHGLLSVFKYLHIFSIRAIYQNIYTESVLVSVNTISVQCLKMYLKNLLPCFQFRKMRLCICRYHWNIQKKVMKMWTNLKKTRF